jgi:hypothetical protein
MSFMKNDKGELLTSIPKDYSDGRTKQSFKDSCDINKILKKAQKVGSLSHLQKHGAWYGDVYDVDDLLSAYKQIERGKEVFNELPAEVRKEFQNDALAYMRFIGDPANKDRLSEVLPQIAEPERYFDDLSQPTRGGRMAEPVASNSEPQGPAESPVEGTTEGGNA